MREVLSREGREAKNLLVYQFCDETTTGAAGVAAVGGSGSGIVVNGDCKLKLLFFAIFLFVWFVSLPVLSRLHDTHVPQATGGTTKITQRHSYAQTLPIAHCDASIEQDS